MNDWAVAGASRDRQSITSDWEFTAAKRIEGVIVREVKNVPKADGHLVELYRTDWGLDQKGIDQVFMVSHLPGAISAWHAHLTSPIACSLPRAWPGSSSTTVDRTPPHMARSTRSRWGYFDRCWSWCHRRSGMASRTLERIRPWSSTWSILPTNTPTPTIGGSPRFI